MMIGWKKMYPKVSWHIFDLAQRKNSYFHILCTNIFMWDET